MYRMTCIYILAASVSVVAYAAGIPSSQSLAVETNETAYVLTVPVSALILTIPKGGLILKNNVIGGSAENPRYFYFEDPSLNLIVSGWFEPDQGFSSIEEFWRVETAAWKKRDLPEPRNVAFEKIGRWDAIIYEIKMPRDSTNSHVRGHWVQAGAWIDIHFSLTSDKTAEENRKQLRSMLEALVVKEKTR